MLGDTPKERRRTLNNGGLTIKTTIDLDMQKAADDSVSAHVYQTDQAIGGLAMVEPGTGDVRALAQSRPMGKDKQGGETYLNYTVPKKYGDANGFQAGSTFKLFVLAAAINQGIPLSTSINSPQTMHFDDWDFETCDGPYAGDQKGWDPENSTGAGTFDLYSGTQHSVNTFFAQLETRTGMCEPLQLAERHGRQGAAGPAGAVVDPRRLRRRPADHGPGLRHLRRARPALRPPPGHPGARLVRRSRSRTSPASASRSCPAPPPTPSTTSCAA